MKSICDRLLPKMCSWNWEKLIFFNINIGNKLMIGISWLVSHEVCIHGQYFFGVVRNKLKLLLESNKRRSKVQEKNMSCERALNFDQWKTFPKTISQWEFDYGLFTNLPRIIVARDFSPSSFKLKRGILPLDKIRILTWKLLNISS